VASANVDLVQSLFAAWERGDYSSVEWAHPDIEWVRADGFSPGSWSGLDGMVAGWRGWLNAWEDFRMKAQEYRELDPERILVLVQYSGRGKTSGLDLGKMEAKGAALFHVRDRKVATFALYLDRARALADLGLASETEAAETEAKRVGSQGDGSRRP
jgi:ketosteroid isomerase-like protein